MHAFRVSGENRRPVVDNLLEACAPDDLERVAGIGTVPQLDWSKFDRRIPAVVDKLEATVRFALECELERKRLAEFARNGEQLCLIAAFEFDLYLADGDRTPAGIDPASVDRNFDRTRFVLERINDTTYAALEQGLESPLRLCG